MPYLSVCESMWGTCLLFLSFFFLTTTRILQQASTPKWGNEGANLDDTVSKKKEMQSYMQRVFQHKNEEKQEVLFQKSVRDCPSQKKKKGAS
jgi:hypothetical protein